MKKTRVVFCNYRVSILISLVGQSSISIVHTVTNGSVLLEYFVTTKQYFVKTQYITRTSPFTFRSVAYEKKNQFINLRFLFYRFQRRTVLVLRVIRCNQWLTNIIISSSNRPCYVQNVCNLYKKETKTTNDF